MAKRNLPFVVGGDKIALMDGTLDNVTPTTFTDVLFIESIINKMPQFVPSRETLERRTLDSQQAKKSAGERPAIDGTIDFYWEDTKALEMHTKMVEYQEGVNKCFWIIWYSSVRNTTYSVRATTDDLVPSPEGISGDEDIASLPLYNYDEAIVFQGNIFDKP